MMSAIDNKLAVETLPPTKVEVSIDESSQHSDEAPPPVEAPLASKKTLWSWMLLCFSTGPTSAVANVYVPAVLQSMANFLGHQPGSTRACAKRGVIKCVVKFGGGEIDYNSYVLYLQAISRACEGVVTIFLSGLADFSNYRKAIMIVSILLFGAFALPFAGLTKRTYPNLIAASTLWCAMTSLSGAYAVMESSYIPLFMRSAGWYTKRARLDETEAKGALNKGARVSVLGLVAGNVGAITALLIGVVISYTRGDGILDGYKNFLLAITIAGSLTVVFGIIGNVLLPGVPGNPRPKGFLPWLAIRRWISLIKAIRQYPEAFKLCVGWILWFTAYSNFASVISLLFREVTGLGRGDPIFTVYSCTAIIFACIGSLGWMYVFPKTRFHIKRWSYGFLAVNMLCVFWGCLGVNSHIPIGYKHTVEFWVEQFLFFSTSSALRSANRVMYASMLPKGREAQFFGLELTLDLATGWINPLIQGTIQNRTHNLRFPMIINIILMATGVAMYVWFDLEKGIEDAKKPLED